jgi:uncharacterized protein with PIN domain
LAPEKKRLGEQLTAEIRKMVLERFTGAVSDKKPCVLCTATGLSDFIEKAENHDATSCGHFKEKNSPEAIAAREAQYLARSSASTRGRGRRHESRANYGHCASAPIIRSVQEEIIY